MTQEWFESADFEKTANNEKKEHPSDPVIPEEELKEKEELPVVEENLQVNPEEQEADLEKVENGEHEEIVENADKSEEPVETEEQEELATKTDQAEKPAKEAPQPSKSLESPFIPDPVVYHAKQGYYGRMASIDAHFMEQFPSLNLFSVFSILVATSLFFFSILMGGFVVKRFVDQNNDWTLDKTFQEYSRLFAIPILLTSLASFFAFFNSLKFAIFLCLISLVMVLLANLYIISKPSKDSQTDPFYRLLLAFLVNGSILFLFFLAEMALVFDYLRILASM